MGGSTYPRFGRLHFTSKYSDLTITCNYRQWAVHRAIVCSRSGFFDGACSSQFREANSGVIDLSEEDEDAVEQMIHFFYHLDYLNRPERPMATMFRHRANSNARRRLPKKLDLYLIEDPLLTQAGCYVSDEPQSPTTPSEGRISPDLVEGKVRSPKSRSQTPPLVHDDDSDYESAEEEDELAQPASHLTMHTRVYALAEKYDIPSLKQLAKTKFEMEMACYYDSPEFAEAIEEVYCSTIDSDRGLRDVVLETFTCHPQLANTQDVFTVIKDTPSLALELFKLERGIPV
ncbi:hypothetical protein LTR37_004047 [Vermiconidia calcicola]|uniref:Uncharacterized protein n=1 Tax=Vermiconidia calcicola TaxID=1690605 RepID=A0ACC3NPA0_9PEZI|nr:hypothetical protein LTR37_004047 [Vermiconidia calcicola]